MSAQQAHSTLQAEKHKPKKKKKRVLPYHKQQQQTLRATITEKTTTCELAHNTPTRALAGAPNMHYIVCCCCCCCRYCVNSCLISALSVLRPSLSLSHTHPKRYGQPAMGRGLHCTRVIDDALVWVHCLCVFLFVWVCAVMFAYLCELHYNVCFEPYQCELLTQISRS